jgi:hypothetical protein
MECKKIGSANLLGLLVHDCRSNKPDGLDGHGTSVTGKNKGFAVAPAAGSATYIEGYCSFTGKHAYDLWSMPASE